MQQTEFLETVRNRTDLDSDDAAETATVATLRTLGVRISEGQAEEVADYLPDELAGTLSIETEQATELSVEEFINRVENAEEEAGIEGDTEAHIEAVMETLAATIDDDQWRAVRTQLPESYDRLVG